MAKLSALKNDIVVGDYFLTPAGQPHYLHSVKRRDGGRVPAALCGLWSSSHDFQRAAERYHGDSYSRVSLREREEKEAKERYEADRAEAALTEAGYRESLKHVG